MGGELMQLEVDRVDGVSHPATRRKFLIRKSADAAATGDAGLAAVVTKALTDAGVSKEHIEKALVNLGTAPGGGTDVGEKPGEKYMAIFEKTVAVARALSEGDEGQTLNEKQATALTGLATAAGIEKAFTFKAGPMPCAADGKKKPGDAHSPLPGHAEMSKTFEPLVLSLTKSTDALLVAAEKMTAVSKAEKIVPSTQGEEDTTRVAVNKAAPKKMGEGLFGTSVFGKQSPGSGAD